MKTRQNEDSASTPSHLHGRGEERGLVRSLLARGETLLVLRGPPGIGKTTLARDLHTSLTREGMRTVFLSVGPLRTRDELLGGIARWLGVPSNTSDGPVLLESVVRQLEAGPVVILLDGAEEAADVVRDVVHDILDHTVGVACVVGSRVSLGSSREVHVVLSALRSTDAETLFVQRVRQFDAKRPLDPSVTRDLLARTAGLPLAIEIVAGWVGAIGGAATLSALEKGELTLDALDQALEASWRLLRADVRRAFAALGTFEGTFDLESARAVCESNDSVGHLSTLARSSLVEVLETSEGTRYAMLEGIRAFARRRFASEEERNTVRARLAMHLARAPRPRADLPSSWARLAHERADLLASWEWAFEHDAPRALRLAVVVEPDLSAHGPATVHRKILETTIARSIELKLAADAPEHARAIIDLHYSLGRFEASRGRHRSSVDSFEQGIRLAEATDDPVRTAWLLAQSIPSRLALGEDALAQERLRRSLDLASQTADERLRATTNRARAFVLQRFGEMSDVESAFQQALISADRANALRLEGLVRLDQSTWYRHVGRLREAAEGLAHARVRFERVGDTFNLGRLRTAEGYQALLLGDEALARSHFEESGSQAALHDDVEGELEAVFGLAACARACGNTHLLERYLEDLAALCKKTDACTWAARLAEARVEVGANASSLPMVLALTRDGRVVEFANRKIDFARRGSLRRVLLALAKHHEAGSRASLRVSDVLEAGWPGEKMLHESGTARVYMSIRRLRAMGLESVLRTSDEGYALANAVRIEWIEG